MLIALLLSWTSAALASSDIEFKTSGPVLIYVDGQQAELTNKLKQRLGDLDPGTHEIKVTGVFGKTLYEAEIELPDNTVTQAEWSDGELKVLSTDWRDEEGSTDDTGAADEELAVEEPEEEVEQPVDEPIEQAPAPPPPAPPKAPKPAPPVAEAPLAIPHTEQATALPPIATSVAKTLTVQAHEGMRVEVVHDGQTVVVVIEGGAFRIEDPSGLQMSLSAQR